MTLQHPKFSRRTALQAGAIGLLGFGMNHLRHPCTPQVPAEGPASPGQGRACIYIFLSGGLAQHDSFDLKPDAPPEIRGEFRPIATRDARRRDLRAPAAAGASGAGTGRWSAR